MGTQMKVETIEVQDLHPNHGILCWVRNAMPPGAEVEGRIEHLEIDGRPFAVTCVAVFYAGFYVHRHGMTTAIVAANLRKDLDEKLALARRRP